MEQPTEDQTQSAAEWTPPPTPDLPPQYAGMPAEIVEDIWTIPIYADPATTAAEHARKDRALAALREKEAAAAISAAAAQQVVVTRVAELRQDLGMPPLPAAPVAAPAPAPEVAAPAPAAARAQPSAAPMALESMADQLATAAEYDKFVNTLVRSADKLMGDWENDEDFMEALRGAMPLAEASVEAARSIAAAIMATGSKDSMVPYWQKEAETALDKLRGYVTGSYMPNNEVQKALYGARATSLASLYKRMASSR